MLQSLPVLFYISQVKKFPRGQSTESLPCESTKQAKVDAVEIKLFHSPLGPTVGMVFTPLSRIWKKFNIKNTMNLPVARLLGRDQSNYISILLLPSQLPNDW